MYTREDKKKLSIQKRRLQFGIDNFFLFLHVHRARFRENVTVFPAVKAIIIDIIIELERFNRICESDLTEYILDLRHQINWS